jgi:transcriptional regulator with XRE-family HTH domain
MNLAAYRKSVGLSQSELAAKLGLSPTSKAMISAIENGTVPAPELALKIEDWSGGVVKAASLNPTVAAIRERAFREARAQQATA